MTLRIDRLGSLLSLVDREGRPTTQFMMFWQKAMQAIENADATQQKMIDQLAGLVRQIQDQQQAIVDIQAQQQAAIEAIQAAMDAAIAAQNTANAAQQAAIDAQSAAGTANQAVTTINGQIGALDNRLSELEAAT